MSEQALESIQDSRKQTAATQIEQYFRSMANRLDWYVKTQPAGRSQHLHTANNGSELVATYRGGIDSRSGVGLYAMELAVVVPHLTGEFITRKRFQQVYGGRLLDMTASSPEDFTGWKGELTDLVGVIGNLHDSYTSATDQGALDMVGALWANGDRLPGIEIITNL